MRVSVTPPSQEPMKPLIALPAFVLTIALARAAAAGIAPDRHGSFPSASPDGTQIAFASSRAAPVPEAETPWLHMHIYVMDADGAHPRQLTDSRRPARFAS
jgi:hypothetical protein